MITSYFKATLICSVLFIKLPAAAAGVEDLVRDLSSKDPKTVAAAAEELGKSPEQAAPLLEVAYGTSESPEVRRRILRLMQRAKSPRATKLARTAISTDKDWMVRQEALSVIGKSRSALEDDALEEAARNDTHRMNRAAAIRWASYKRKAKSVAMCKALLDDSDPLIRAESARELGRNGDDSGYEVARALIDHSDIHVKSSAVEAIGLIGKKSGAALILPIATSTTEHQHVRFAAIRALKQIEYKDLPGNKRDGYLASALSDDSWAVRTWAISELKMEHEKRPAKVQEIIKPFLANPKHVGYEQAFQLKRAIELGDEQ